MEEDLIEAADQDQRLAPPIEVLQDPPRRDPGGLDPAVERGSTGACLRPQDQRQQDEDLIEAQAHGRGRDGELVLLVRGELDGLSQPFPEPRILLAEVVRILLDQFGTRRPAGVLGRDGGLDLLGMVVDGLSAAVGGLGLMGDVTIVPVKHAAALAIQVAMDILSMGGPLAVWIPSAIPLLRSTPSHDQDVFDLVFQSVNLKSTDSAQIGTIPNAISTDPQTTWGLDHRFGHFVWASGHQIEAKPYGIGPSFTRTAVHWPKR